MIFENIYIFLLLFSVGFFGRFVDTKIKVASISTKKLAYLHDFCLSFEQSVEAAHIYKKKDFTSIIYS